ncbi:hypothetical protein LguiB_002566 [Lonicera macranthoides]
MVTNNSLTWLSMGNLSPWAEKVDGMRKTAREFKYSEYFSMSPIASEMPWGRLTENEVVEGFRALRRLGFKRRRKEMGAPEVELTNFVNAIKKYLSEHVELPKPDGLVIDWSDSGRVSQVRDQKSAKGIRLNIQELVDEFGIDSGEVENAFEYIQNNGLSPESECRWTGRVRTKRRHVKDQGEIYVAPTLNPVMLSKLLKEQMHFVLVVGWGKQKGTEKRYFKVKNSWGTTWADKGYGLVDEAAVLGLAYPIDPEKVNNS